MAKNNAVVFLCFKMTSSGFLMFFLRHMSLLERSHSTSINEGENSENHLKFLSIGWNKALVTLTLSVQWGPSITETKKLCSSKRSWCNLTLCHIILKQNEKLN